MAVILGTNAGFVTVSPDADPLGLDTGQDGSAKCTKDTSPAGNWKITEMGWWCADHNEGDDFDIGLYSHDSGNDVPLNLLQVDRDNATNVVPAWNKITGLNWEINPSTVYWLGLQLDPMSGTIEIDYAPSGGRTSVMTGWPGGYSLVNPWVSVGTTDYIMAVYAKIEESVAYSELAGTCAGTGDGSGDLELKTYSALAGTCVGEGDGSGDLGSVLVHTSGYHTYRYLVVAGNNQIWYEDI